MGLLLNEILKNYDYTILYLLNAFASITGGVFTPVFEVISLISNKGIGMILLGIVLMFFKKTRKAGICVVGAIICGIVISNVILKDMIARPRPFEDTLGVYYTWWKMIGSPAESGYSFPSGHVTLTMAAMTALFLNFDKKKSWPVFLFVLLMGISRNYLMVHYPSDVVGGILVGGIGALISFYIIKFICYALEKYSNKKLC